MNEVQRQQEFVLRRLSEGWQVAGRELSGRLWLAVLVPVLLLGLLYVIWMYRRDSQTIRWPWAVFLGLCRSAVYLILAGVFLLPAMQTWETTQKRSRVVLMLDVSPSISDVSDDLPPEDGSSFKQAKRLDKVVAFLAESDFLKKLTEKNPVSVYRFGARLDEEPAIFDQGSANWDADRWSAWLKLDLKRWILDQLDAESSTALERHPAFAADKPGTVDWAATWLALSPREALPGGLDPAKREKLIAIRARLVKRIESISQCRAGTSVGESVLQLFGREGNAMLQGVVVVSDGRSTLGSESSLAEVRARAVKDTVPVFTVQLGEDRQPVEIRITDVQTPELTPPNEKFVVRAEIDGVGLPDEETTVYLDIYGPKATEPTATLETKAKFQPGAPPHATAEFTIDPDEKAGLAPGLLSAENKREFLEGDWRFVVRTPRDKREAFAAKEHVAEPATVHVVKKPLRVLLVASGPTFDYQFLRTLLVRESDHKRAELSIFLQNEGRDGRAVQDVPPERYLSRFPSALSDDDANEKPEDRYYNLARYDTIIAFDPDWSEFTAEQLELLKTWVERQPGGLIVVAGPVNTFQLVRAEEGGRLKPLLELLPVLPGDIVLGGSARRSSKQPWRLHFTGANAETDFLKLDDDSKEPLAGWKEFFDGSEAVPGPNPIRGFYSSYPIKDVKPGATVVATFADPSLRTSDGKEQPFLVTQRYGNGRVVFLGSSEMRRLRQYKVVFYERFWMKLARWAAAGGRSRQNRRGVLVMGRQFTTGGTVRIEAQFFKANYEPVERTTRAKAVITTVEGSERREVEFIAKPGTGEWAGWFQARFPVNKSGDYRIEVPVPGAGDLLRGKFTVKAADPELDNPRPDPAALYALAGEFKEVEGRLAGTDRETVLSQLRGASPGDRSAGESPRLCVALSGAGVIPGCMTTQRKELRNRGAVDDLWDDGPVFGTTVNGKKIEVAWVLLAVVGLLSVEWLTRKLLRLA